MYIEKLTNTGWTVVYRSGNRKQLRRGIATESAPVTALNLTLAEAACTAQAMNKDAKGL